MAIQTNYDFHGVTVPNVYIRIDRVMGGKSQGWSGVALVYKDKQTFEENGSPIAEVNLPIPIRNEPATDENDQIKVFANPWAIDLSNFNPDAYAVLYERLKDKFPDSVDV
jgi:hypothetical protein